MKVKLLLSLLFVLSMAIHADEGMWIPGMLNKQTVRVMKELGLQMPIDSIYSSTHPSLKDAIVSFGGFCSGVVVSEDGLVFTNHHCGFEAISRHTTLEHNYLKDGFVAKNREEELPNPELFVSFLIRTEDVTERILSAVSDTLTEQERSIVVDSMSLVIQNEVFEQDSLLRGLVDSYSHGNEYYLSVYKDYTDVRLVFAPPSSVGKFGADTDNWVWPRHTGDFAVFRIYADKENQPAEYAEDNRPYHPAYVAPISLAGYTQDSYCMTLGYPGTTHRYLSSWGTIERMEAQNDAMITIRGIKQDYWKRAMEADEALRIKYASKYAVSANYWKNSIGMNRSIEKLEVVQQKRRQEEELREWMMTYPELATPYLHLFTQLEENYVARKPLARAVAYFSESFVNSAELTQVALRLINFDGEDTPENVSRAKKEILDLYANIDWEMDKKVFVSMLETYYHVVDSIYLPNIYVTIRDKYNNDYQKYADYLYSHSSLIDPQTLERVAANDSTFQFLDDPVVTMALDVLLKYYELSQMMEQSNTNLAQTERLFDAALRKMYSDRNYYPDANSTMRLSFGRVGSYSPVDGVTYTYSTSTKGIFEKVRQYSGNSDFAVEPALLKLLANSDFGRYANGLGELNVCFISDNDITGGNSGSAMFNGNGELLGLAFDGNWEGMSSDLIYESTLQKCVGVDVRYILFLIEKYGCASHIIEEIFPKEE